MTHSIEEIKKNIAYLEYANAQLIKDLFEADRILKEVGFEHGLQTVKAAAQEIIRIQSSYKNHEDETTNSDS